jgi:hypothetical protein
MNLIKNQNVTHKSKISYYSIFKKKAFQSQTQMIKLNTYDSVFIDAKTYSFVILCNKKLLSTQKSKTVCIRHFCP